MLTHLHHCAVLALSSFRHYQAVSELWRGARVSIIKTTSLNDGTLWPWRSPSVPASRLSAAVSPPTILAGNGTSKADVLIRLWQKRSPATLLPAEAPLATSFPKIHLLLLIFLARS